MADLELINNWPYGNLVKGAFATGEHDERVDSLRSMLKEELRIHCQKRDKNWRIKYQQPIR